MNILAKDNHHVALLAELCFRVGPHVLKKLSGIHSGGTREQDEANPAL